MPAIKLKKVTAEYLAEKEREAEKNKRNLEDVADEEEDKAEKDDEDGEEKKSHNFLDVEVLWDKRKRTIPVVEQILIDWLDSNLEKRTEVYLPLQTLYNYYSEVCQMRGASVVDIPLFNRYIREKFGKFFGFQENSPYRVLIKERKLKERKKVQGETLQLKIRDIITEVIADAGNPRKGLRFPVISKAIVSKYPAQRVDLYPKKLKAALERGLVYGHFELCRGVGMCGYYRLPGEPTKEEEEEDKKDKKKEDQGQGEAKQAENGTADTDEGKSGEEGGGAKEGEEEKAGTKRLAPGEGGDAADQAEPPKKKAKKKVNKKKKKKPVERVYRSEAQRHSDPQRVDDVFPMAITYQSDPKEASGSKISKYIARYYHRDLNPEKLKRALEAGVEKGLWEQIKGSGLQGTYHLLSESFNPGRSDSISDQISQALVACHEPKTASAGLIKKYIVQYHSKLNIEAKPNRFKKALERACQKGTIRQLSGIGAHGTFQLMDQFNPSPAFLAGEAEDSDEEEEESSDEEEPVYIPKPTKRGRLPSKSSSRAPSTRDNPKKGKKTPTKSQSKSGKSGGGSSKKAARGGGRKKYAESSDEEEVEGWIDEKVEYLPKPTKSRGGGGASGRQAAAASKASARSVAKPAKKATPKSQPAGKGAKKSAAKAAAESSSKKKSSAKKSGGKAAGKGKGASTSPRKAVKRKLMDSGESEDEVNVDDYVDDYVPKPSKSRGGGSGGGAESSAKKRRR